MYYSLSQNGKNEYRDEVMSTDRGTAETRHAWFVVSLGKPK